MSKYVLIKTYSWFAFLYTNTLMQREKIILQGIEIEKNRLYRENMLLVLQKVLFLKFGILPSPPHLKHVVSE